MDKKYQIFISSTYEDLKEERQKVVGTILKGYNIPIGMEMFSADDEEQWKLIKQTIEESDYYIVIIKDKYGSLTKEGISYTEKEYDFAIESGIPVLGFVLDKKAEIKRLEVEDDPKKMVLLEKFKKKVLKNKMCDFWHNADELCTLIQTSLQMQFRKNRRIGWIRQSDAIKSITTFDNYNESALLFMMAKLREQFSLIHGNINGANEFLTMQEERLLHQVRKETYIDLFDRQVVITLLDSGYRAKITMTTRIDFINVKEGIQYYASNPRFMTQEQAESYKHIEFSINDKELTEKIQSEISNPTPERQFPYLITNKYPLTYETSSITLLHHTEYEMDIRDFFQSYQLIFPCKNFLVTLMIKGENNNRFSIVSTTYSSYNVHTNEDYSREYRKSDISTIRISKWSLPGSGYVFRVVENRNESKENTLMRS